VFKVIVSIACLIFVLERTARLYGRYRDYRHFCRWRSRVVLLGPREQAAAKPHPAWPRTGLGVANQPTLPCVRAATIVSP
jgi:hypothetical protein